MPDATTHTEIALAVGTTSATIIAGTAIGDIYLVLALALLGGTISHIWLAKMEFGKMVLSIFGSTALGAVLAILSTDVVISTAKHFAPWLVISLSDNEICGKMLVAFTVSFLAQKCVPIFFKWLDSKGGASA